MPFQEIGSQTGDQPKTPTLRQYAAKGGQFPKANTVSVIFKPGKLPNWSMVADNKFRVTVYEDNPLHGAITDSIEEWVNSCACLSIMVVDGLKGEWSLAINTDESVDWKEFSWGYKAEIMEKPKTRSRKAP